VSLQAAKCKRGKSIHGSSYTPRSLADALMILSSHKLKFGGHGLLSRASEMHAMSFTFHCIGTESRYASVLNSDRLLALLRDLELSIILNSAFGSSPYLFAPKLPLKAKLFSLRFDFFSCLVRCIPIS